MVANILLGVLCLLLIFVIKDKQKGLKWVFFCITFFLSIRYAWGNDYLSYLETFIEYKNYQFGLFDIEQSGMIRRNNEYGWVILNRIFGVTGLGFFGLIIALTIFENWVIYRLVSKHVDSQYYWVSIIFYVLTTSFVINASMMRQYLCICLYLIVVELMIDKKVRGYLFWSIGIILLGSTIHRSNIMMLITLPLFYVSFKQKKRTYIWLVVIGIAFIIWSFFSYNLVKNMLLTFLDENDEYASYAHYMYWDKGGSDTGLGTIFRYIKFAVWLYLLAQFKEHDKQIIIILGIASYFFEVVAAIVPMAGRFHSYFIIMDMVRWAWLIQFARKQKWLYVIFVAQIAVLIKTFPEFFYDSTWIEHCLHYHTIFEAGSWM